MTETSLLSEQRIIECLQSQYGIEVTTLLLLPLGADIYASTYKAQACDQSSYFLKVKRNHDHDISTRILTMLHDAGIQQVIPPVNTLHGPPTQQLDDFTLSVFPFVEGQNGFNQELTDDQWTTFGQVMQQIHNLKVPSSLQSMMRRETYSPKWRQAVRSFYPIIEPDSGSDQIAVELRAFMKKRASVIHRLVERAEQLAQKVQDQSPQFVLCHSDIHGGNILIDGKGALYIVDWDDPIMAPKERDLMFIGGGVGNVWNKPHETKCFYEGYGKEEVNRTLLAYYRYERIIEDIAVYCQELLLSPEGGPERPKLYKEFMSQFDPQGVVEIAFKTDGVTLLSSADE